MLGDEPVAEGFGAGPGLAAGRAAGEEQEGVGVGRGLLDGKADVADVIAGFAFLEIEQEPAFILFDEGEVAEDRVAGHDDEIFHGRALERLGDAEGVRVGAGLDGAVFEQADHGGGGAAAEAGAKLDAVAALFEGEGDGATEAFIDEETAGVHRMVVEA